MPSADFFGRLAGVISLAAFFPYILSILRGYTKPNRASWAIWTVVGTMLGGSYYASGAGSAIWVPVSYIVGPFVTFLLSFKYNDGKELSGLEKGCLYGSGASAVLWLILFLVFGDKPGISEAIMSINIFIDFMGALPTIRQAYYKPESEDKVAWSLFIIGNTINLLAVSPWNIITGAYPVYMFLASGTIAGLVIFRRK